MLDTQSSYSKLAASGAIEPDTAQQRVAARLDLLLQQLGKKQASGISALGRLVGKKPASPPKGLYIWGEVGRGKTLLMDLFFDAAPVEDKRRVHFHAFMVEVHGRLHEARGNGSGDAITAVAEALAKEARLLCMDEFQVTDIADAMILSRLFGALFERGVVLVATSNQPPERLYYKGLNRELFLPFLALLEQRVDVVKLESRTDFRLEKLSSVPVWHVPADDEAKSALDETFLKLTGAREGRPESLRVQGRDVRVPDALDGVARFSFDDLCATARGPADFGAIAERYHTVFIDGIPVLDRRAPDAVRRFVILIDELYDNRVKLVASAEAEPEALLTSGRQAEDFKRTASRLVEMRSHDWLALPHGRSANLNGQRDPG